MQDKHLYEYAVIRIVPRVEREEFLNAGIILYCKRPKFIKVLYTINEAKLKAERDALEAKSLARINQVRAEKGLPAIKKGDKPTKEDALDFIEDESMNIMIDFMKQTEGAKLSKNMNKPAPLNK